MLRSLVTFLLLWMAKQRTDIHHRLHLTVLGFYAHMKLS